ncbi:hypothetical protein ACFSC4_16870 [Deinococcus malanensis]|uniref:hypothetical protein n=1 Tax=Deinococcus malanensis TaxID=1706855 RepID=UPI00362A1DF2
MPDFSRPAWFLPSTCLALTLLLGACAQDDLQATTARLGSQEVSGDAAAWTAPEERPSLEEGRLRCRTSASTPVCSRTSLAPTTPTRLPWASLPGHEQAGAALTAQATYLTCRNEPSGPYLRIQTDQVRTGAVNFVEGTAHLPAVRAIPTAFPYIYLGGQPREGVAADAGSTSTMTAAGFHSWPWRGRRDPQPST